MSDTIGRTDGTGSIAIPGTVTFADPTIFNAPGGTIDITGTLIGIDNAAFTFNTTLGMTLGNIITPGTDLTFNAPITLATPATLSTGDAPLPGNITFNGSINGDNPLTLTAGTGTIQFNGPVGNTAPIGSLTVTSAANTTATANITTANGDITINSPLAVTAPITVNAGSATLTLNSTVTTGPNNTTFTADEINFNGGPNSVSGTGNLILQPFTPSLNIEIGGFVPAAGRLDLDFADMRAIGNGFNRVTIGREASSGTITIPNPVTFLDPFKIQTPLGANTIIANGPITLIDNASIELLALGNIIFNTIDALNATGNVVITSTAGRAIGTGTFLTDAGPTTIATSTGTVTITGGVVPDVPFTIGLPFDSDNPDAWNGTLGVIRTAAETFPAGKIIYGSETSPGGTMTVNAGGQRPPEPPIEPPVAPPVAPPEEPPIEPPVEPPAEEPPVEDPPVEPPVAPPDGDGMPDIRPDPTRNLLYPTLHEGKRRKLAEIVAQVDQNDFNLRLSLMLNNALKALEQGDGDAIRQIEEARQFEFQHYFGVNIDCSYLDTSIREESPQGSQEVSCKVLTLSEIQKSLRELAAQTGHIPAVIYTIPRLDRLNGVLVKPDGNPIVKSVLEANVVTLVQQIQDFHKVAQRYDIQPNEREYQAASQPLYDWIVGAIAPDSNKPVLIPCCSPLITASGLFP